MKKPGSVKALEDLGRVRLSPNYFMRDFLYSEIAAFHGIQNIPDDPDLAIAVGTRLCEELLEPLKSTFGHVVVRSSFRSAAVNQFGNENNLNCSRNEANYAHHIWDRRDSEGRMGATACIVIPWFLDRYEDGADWRSLAWWVHDNLPAYNHMCFFPRLCAFNLNWREEPEHRIDSFIGGGKSCLTKPGMENNTGDHSTNYPGFPELRRPERPPRHLNA